MERLLGQHGAAMPEQVRSAECPSEHSERLERLVRGAVGHFLFGMAQTNAPQDRLA